MDISSDGHFVNTKSDLRVEFYSINLQQYNDLLALFHTFSEEENNFWHLLTDRLASADGKKLMIPSVG